MMIFPSRVQWTRWFHSWGAGTRGLRSFTKLPELFAEMVHDVNPVLAFYFSTSTCNLASKTLAINGVGALAPGLVEQQNGVNGSETPPPPI